MDEMTIGVLALQGAYFKHMHILHCLGVQTVEVRKPRQLVKCDGLIIPGGESTAIMKRIEFIDMSEALHEFASEKPVFGTCAGLILMSQVVENHDLTPFGWMNLTVARNSYGRQVESFDTDVECELFPNTGPVAVKARFIRAPRITSCGAEVKVLGRFNGEPVLVQQGKHLASSFHPELSSDFSIHQYFLYLITSRAENLVGDYVPISSNV